MNLSSFLYLKFWFHKIHPLQRNLQNVFASITTWSWVQKKCIFVALNGFSFQFRQKKRVTFHANGKGKNNFCDYFFL